ncbi:MAG: hypothetical protein HRU15_20830 [Planctomycetes bacterium]|nr:hypothetical protein [Planctomycetota bacterium]
MHFPTFWSKATCNGQNKNGQESTFSAWGSSDNSQAEAVERAEKKAHNICQVICAGEQAHRYLYSDRPLREEVVEIITDEQDKTAAIVSRNYYGCLVLNTAAYMFIDIDIPHQLPSFMQVIGKLFGKTYPSAEDTCLQTIKDYMNKHVNDSMRVYRTKAGFRCLITNNTFDPQSSQTQQLMQSLAADPLYIKLCRVQKCFRARLTPKPWRCGIADPPHRYPYNNDSAEKNIRQWQADYQQQTTDTPVCRLVCTLGKNIHSEVLQKIIDLHDSFTIKKTNSELA